MEKRERLALGIVLVAAFVLRLLHLQSLSHDVLFEHPALDEERYVSEARRLASGRTYEPRAFWQPPGILFVVGFALRVLGSSLYPARLLGALAGTAACALAYLVARRLFDARVALGTAVIVAIHGGLVFAGGELLPATWAGLFDLIAILLLLDAPKSGRHAAAAGFALGVSALFTPVILPFAIVVAAVLYRQADDKRVAFAFAAMVMVPILPVTLRNWERGHELVLISTNGGLNFYIGNNEQYFETLAVRPGPHWTELAELPYRAAHIQAPGASSAWFTERGLAFWASHPLQAMGLYLRKVFLFFHGAEIPRDFDLYQARDSSPVLRLLTSPSPFFFPAVVVMPLAIVGMVLSSREAKKLWLLFAFVASQVLVISLFFPSGRYRVPAVPVLAMFAVAGAIAIAKRPVLALAPVVLAVLLSLPTRETKMRFAAEPDLFRGLAYRGLGDATRALESFQRATVADPHDARPWFEIGMSLDALGR
ncbi:MAG: glycosyltransferase family 39 protein, partial [Polyangiales bacterium]